MEDIIKKEHYYEHSIEKVWNAISVADEISSWFIKADFKAEVGYKYTFTSKENDCSQITGIVKAANPYTLIYTWIVAGTDVETTVKWVLEETNEGTKLYLEHSGILNYSNATAIEFFNNFNNGWDNCFTKLSAYLTQEVHAG